MALKQGGLAETPFGEFRLDGLADFDRLDRIPTGDGRSEILQGFVRVIKSQIHDEAVLTGGMGGN